MHPYNPPISELVLFALAWAVGVYLISCILGKSLQRVNVRKATLYFAGMSMMGVGGEICFNTFYSTILGHPFWNYTVYPIYHAYTSLYAIVLWGIYGFLLYLQHNILQKRIPKRQRKRKPISLHKLVLIFWLEAVPVEMLVNITYKLSFGDYAYYYFPSDLWHLSSLQTLPFYLVAGYVITLAFRKFETSPTLYTWLSVGMVGVLAYLG